MLLRTLREICGLDRGFCHGRGGSMHLQWHEAGAIGTNAIVGGGVPLAAGSAWAHKHAGTDAVAVTYFGDGATNIGSTLETLNLAAAWKLPLCFFIENNQYAVSTHVAEATGGAAPVRPRARASASRSWKVDGMDPLAVYLATQEALEHMRSGNGPTLIEADVYRYFHQNGPFPGSAFGYRTKEEEAEWRGRDPLDQVARATWSAAASSTAGRRRRRRSARAKALMAEFGDELLEPHAGRQAAASAGSSPPNGRTRPSSTSAIRGDLSEFADCTFADARRPSTGELRGRQVHRRRRRRHGPADGDRRPRSS